MTAFIKCQQPMTCALVCTLARSLYGNDLGPEGARHIAAALGSNSSLEGLEYATPKALAF